MSRNRKRKINTMIYRYKIGKTKYSEAAFIL